MRPVNPNNSLRNGHIWVAGMSESGKTSYAKKRTLDKADHVLIFDPYGDYTGRLVGLQVRAFKKLADVYRAAKLARRKKAGCRIAWSPDRPTTPADFDKFCQVVWALGDGNNKPLKVVLEEVAEHSETAGKAKGYHGQLLRVGRKFNIHTINLFQRGQEVSKTILDNCRRCAVMMQKTEDSAKYIQQKTGIPAEQIATLAQLEYIEQDGKAWKRGKIHF
ncbi:ATP-binding protein [Salinivibrio sp. IB872]|uniref:ATP-binding protein n=1 Tax=Salinivibrio sp. IB872 TaxID=1766123 RepID=UPI0009863AB5|nr:ATP-binding protein [Salinivibrio sp. IB872]OOF25728.1 ATPase [Salinivibrio sp. IB872]